MKYGELFDLNPIQSVIQLEQADRKTEARRLVKSFVITPSLGDTIKSVVLPQLDFESGAEGKGIFVVGNYGTGKSHVMSFLSIIAEDEAAVASVQDAAWHAPLMKFAGKYCVKRCEIGGTLMNFYQIVAEQLEELAKTCNFSFTFRDQRVVRNVKVEFERFMTEFDKHCPGKGVLLLIDELLEFLKTRNDSDLVLDLATLRALGEFCDGSRFSLMAGIQELLYNNPRFNHIAADVNRVRQRFYDFVIDNKGVKQLIEQHLFRKTDEQRQKIREIMLTQAHLFEVVGPEIEQFVALFPAHPRFIDEFQRVFVVERREILTILSNEAKLYAERELDERHIDLITADEYWKHIEADAGLNANAAVRTIKSNVATLKGKIENGLPPNEDKIAAEKLVEALAVHRLTTPNITDATGLTPENLKNNLLWYTPIPMDDPQFLTRAAQRLLDSTRKAANGQFLAVSEGSGQYYIDPTRVVDYEQDVATAAETLAKHVVQRYLNEVITRALEIDNDKPILEGRLWSYYLLWQDHNVERPGWLFFGYPNQRSTARPPKDFYVFIIPSERIMGKSDETIPNNPDETYWYFEDFPAAKCENSVNLAADAPDTFLDSLRKYAAACERANSCAPGDDQKAFKGIASNILKNLVANFADHAGDWIRVKYNGQTKTFSEWVLEIDPSKANALLKTRFDAISQAMFAPHFESRYPNYPVFGFRVQEATRPQSASSAIEVLCEIGMKPQNGQAVLAALKLYMDDTFTPDQSPWLTIIREKLRRLSANQFINNSELFEQDEDKWWFKGERLEAEWLLVVLAAGVRAGDMHLYGKQGNKFDAANLAEFYKSIKSQEDVTRIGRPSELPLDTWRRLFKLFDVNVGLLSNAGTYDKAVLDFNTSVIKRINDLVELAEAFKAPMPFVDEAAAERIAEQCKSIDIAKRMLETYLQPINTKGKMQNLKMGDAELDDLELQLQVCNSLKALHSFLSASAIQTQISALERWQPMLTGCSQSFTTSCDNFTKAINALYTNPHTLKEERETIKSLLTTATDAAVELYQNLHRKLRLDKAADDRKKALMNGISLKKLNRLANIVVLNSDKLNIIQNMLGTLVSCNGCADAELLRSARSLCTKCGFNPADSRTQTAAAEALDACEMDIEELLSGWEQQLLSELEDPSSKASLALLTPEACALLQQFVDARQLPNEITDGFTNAVNTVLKGLKRREIHAQDFARTVLGDSVPLKPEEVQTRFEKWLKERIGHDDQTAVRFILVD